MDDSQAPIAIIPAAGRGTRLAPFPCPKELYPIGFQSLSFDSGPEMRPKVIAQYVVEQCSLAGAKQIFMVLGDGKHDIMRYFGCGKRFQTEIAYLYQEELLGMPQAIDLAFPWSQERDVLLGMPDTIVLPNTALQVTYQSHRDSNAALTLGLFPTKTPHKFGMVDWDESTGSVRWTIDKPQQSPLQYMWGLACWSSEFTQLLHDFMSQNAVPRVDHLNPSKKELLLGDVFNLAILNKLKVQAVPFPQGQFMDIGTADELDATLKKFHLQ